MVCRVSGLNIPCIYSLTLNVKKGSMMKIFLVVFAVIMLFIVASGISPPVVDYTQQFEITQCAPVAGVDIYACNACQIEHLSADNVTRYEYNGMTEDALVKHNADNLRVFNNRDVITPV